jgi:hypothetical protein
MGPLNAARGFSRERTILFTLSALGAVARVVSVFFDRPLHPDEYFQYLEPAYTQLTGLGIQAWEFRSGLRSWVLPFYHGAWLAALMAVGIHKGSQLLHALQVQAALLNAALVWIAYRGGASVTRKLTAFWPRAQPGAPTPDSREAWAGFEGGAYAAFLCAAFPLLVLYSGHTLSEQPSMLLLCLGLVELCELSEQDPAPTRSTLRKAALAGFFLSSAACLRIANGPLVLIAPIFLLVTKRYRALLWLTIAALLPALVFGLVDLFTWGKFANSYIEYVKFNFIQGKAVMFGTEPPFFYFGALWKRAPCTAPILLGLSLLGWRRNYMFLAPLLLGLSYLSSQPHKEERFVLFVWPLLFISAGAVLAAARRRPSLFARGPNTRGKAARPWLYPALALALLLAVPLEDAFHVQGRSWLSRAPFQAEAVVAQDPTLTGLMIDTPIFAGGALWLGVSAPHFDFVEDVLPNPLITHVVVVDDSKQRQQAEKQGFKEIDHIRRWVVLRRLPALR